MTRVSIREYTEAVRGQYLQCTKGEKGRILDEFTKVIGCHRKAAIRRLRLYVNFFQPVMKLVAKTRHGAKGHKVYDTARTPYQRLLEAGVLTEAKRQELAVMYYGLNPVSLLKQINENLECLWKLAERPVHQHRKAETGEASVTIIMTQFAS